jgi:hypothetical protein
MWHKGVLNISRHGSVVEHIIGNDEVDGSIPSGGTSKYASIY